jgi:hypothetical protein
MRSRRPPSRETPVDQPTMILMWGSSKLIIDGFGVAAVDRAER